MLKKLIRILLLVSLTAPLWYTPFTFFPANFGKAVLFTALVEILVGLHALRYLLSSSEEKSRGEIYLALTDYLLLGFFAIVIVTCVTGVNPANSWWGNQSRATGVFVWVHALIWFWLIRAYADKAWWRQAFITTSVTGIIASLTAIFPQVLPLNWQPIDNSRISGIIGNPSYLAGYLVFALSATSILSVSAASRRGKIIWGLLAIFLFITLFFTGTRGAFIGATLGLVLFAFLQALTNPKLRRPVLWGGAGLAAILIVFIALGQTGTFQRLGSSKLDTLFHVTNFFEGTGKTRLLVWSEALKGIIAKPLTGYGWGNFDVPFNKFYRTELFRYSFSETVWDKPHNWPLEIAVTTGIFGLAFYLALIMATLIKLYRANKNLDNPADRQVAFVVVATLVAALVSGFFFFEILATIIGWFFFLSYAATHSSSAPAVNQKSLAKLAPLVSLSAYLYFLVLFISLYNFHYLPVKASGALSTAHASGNAQTWAINVDPALNLSPLYRYESAIFLAERLTQLDKAGGSVTGKATVGAARLTAGVLEEAFKKYPNNPTYPLWAGEVYSVIGESADNQSNLPDAVRTLSEAVALSPQKQDMLLLLGRAYLLQKNFPEGIKTIQRVVDADPTVAQAWWFLGLGKVSSGDTASGIKDIEKALSLGFGPNQDQKLYIIDLYAELKDYDTIIKWYRDFITAEPDKVDWYVKLAATYAAAGRKAEALDMVKQAVAIYPGIKPEADKFIKDNKLE